MAKAKAGKKRKVAARKNAVVRKPAPRKAAPKAAPSAPPKAAQTFPCKKLVHKGAESIPVDVANAEQLAKLVETFGEANVKDLVVPS